MNPEHVEIVRKGTVAIAEWRRNHPRKALNLVGADFQGAQLAGADLSRANLHNARIGQANLVGSYMEGAKLSGINSFETNFVGACLLKASFVNGNIAFADFTFADLGEADLSNSELIGVKFIHTILDGSKFAASAMVDNTFVGCNLAGCKGLETVKHEGPNNIDLATINISFRNAGNRLTSELETFFLNSGLHKDFLEALPKILAEVQYCSSFVCYGSPDLRFAKKLRKDLMVRGVSCWLYSLDAIPGERTWREITLRRREAEKMIVLCSAKALIRDGVLKEIEEQIDEDPDKIVPISLDDTWKQHGFLVKRAQRDLKPFLLDRNYADFSDPSKYNQSLLRLLKGLKRN